MFLPSRFPLAVLVLAAGLSVAAPSPGFAKGPPWVSIELPANPWDQSTRGAYLLVHVFHHGLAMQVEPGGTAEGMVNGQRRSVPLRFEKASRPGVYALRNQWGAAGRWVLVITVNQGGHEGAAEDIAQAVVEISEDGSVTSVRVPTREDRGRAFPRRVTQAEIDAALRGARAS
jgi:hypothetical protein